MSLKEQQSLHAAIKLIRRFYGQVLDEGRANSTEAVEALWDEYRQSETMKEILSGIKPKKSVFENKEKNPDFVFFVNWYCAEYSIRNSGQKYLFFGVKDGQAVKRLLKNYCLEDLKKKAIEAWCYSGSNAEFFRTNANSLSGLLHIASRLGGNNTQGLAEPGKFEKIKPRVIQ